MMKPPCRSSQGRAARVTRDTERTLRSMTASICASLASSEGTRPSMRPALLMSPSMRPNASPVAATMASQSARFGDVALDQHRRPAGRLDLAQRGLRRQPRSNDS